MISASTPSKPTGRDVRYGIPRNDDALKCGCGGYAERVEPTQTEMEEFNCRGRLGCCTRAFVCCICANRIVGMAEAPEMDTS